MSQRPKLACQTPAAKIRRQVERAKSNRLAKSSPPSNYPDSFQVVVQCASEEEQRRIYERLCGEGFTCRLLVM